MVMDALEEAMAALRTAEQKLRFILVQAAGGGDYEHLSQIAEWAKLLSATLNGQPVTGPIPASVQAPAQMLSDNGNHGRTLEARSRATARTAKGGRRRKPRRSKGAKSGYPQFHREGELLVKVGWSKTEGKPYEHKAPRSVLRALVQALIRVGSGGERFTMERLLPLKDLVDGAEIPDYQTYLTLAWLRGAGLITQHGRQGYSLPAGSNLERESDRQWGELKKR
jgi:hypothetical protein